MERCCCDCVSMDNHKKENNAILKSASLKVTKKRVLMINCLRHSEKPLSAEDIHSIINEDVDINLSTVYRALNALVDNKIVIKQTLSDGNSVFQLNTTEHQHILTCKICNSISYIDICPIEDIKEKVEKKSGYNIIGHNLEFIGVCPKCQKEIEKSKSV